MPLVSTMEAAVDDIIDFLFSPDNSIQHYLAVWMALVASNPIEHDRPSSVESF